MDRLGARERVRTIGPLALAVFGFGVSFGVLARAAGMGAFAPIVMSATTFAGSAQFAALSVAGDGGTVVAAVVAALLLNARYVPIGISVAPSVQGPVWRRFVLGQLTVDESWALSSQGNGTFDVRTLALAGVSIYVGWVVGRRSGFRRQSRGEPVGSGWTRRSPLFSACVTGAAAATPIDRRVALLGGAVALVLIPLAPAGVPIIAASAACLLGLRKP